MASKLKIFAPRQACDSDTQYYVCSSNGFEGCCSVDPCSLPGCPDNASSSSDAQSATAAATSSVAQETTTPALTVAEASSTNDSEPTTVASSTEDIEPAATTSISDDTEPTTIATSTAEPVPTIIYPIETTFAADTTSYSSYTVAESGSVLTTAITSQGTLLTTTISRQADSTAPSSSSSTAGASTASNHTSSSVPIGAVVGGVLGALVLGALIALFFVFLRRRKRRDPEYSPPVPQASHRASMASLGKVFRFDAKHASSPNPNTSTPSTPSMLGFWKRDSKGPVSAEASPVPQLDGYPVSTGRYDGGLVELQDTSRPAELPGDDVPRRRGAGG